MNKHLKASFLWAIIVAIFWLVTVIAVHMMGELTEGIFMSFVFIYLLVGAIGQSILAQYNIE